MDTPARMNPRPINPEVEQRRQAERELEFLALCGIDRNAALMALHTHRALNSMEPIGAPEGKTVRKHYRSGFDMAVTLAAWKPLTVLLDRIDTSGHKFYADYAKSARQDQLLYMLRRIEAHTDSNNERQ